MPDSSFTPALRDELIEALRVISASPGAEPEHNRLAAVTDAVCVESHRAGLTPEAMVIALHRIYDAAKTGGLRNDARLRNAYDRFLDGCLRVYFERREQKSTEATPAEN